MMSLSSSHRLPSTVTAKTAAMRFKALVNCMGWFLANMETSKTSIRAFRFKSYFNAAFFEDQQAVPYDVDFLACEISESSEFVARRLLSWIDAKRIVLEQGRLFPGERLIEIHRQSFIDTQTAYTEHENRFQIQTKYPLVSVASDYAELLRDSFDRATVTQLCVELVLWENDCLDPRSFITASDIGRRLNLQKSTLSSCLDVLSDGGQLLEKAHPFDDRKKVLRLNPEHSMFPAKRQLLEVGLWSHP